MKGLDIETRLKKTIKLPECTYGDLSGFDINRLHTERIVERYMKLQGYMCSTPQHRSRTQKNLSYSFLVNNNQTLQEIYKLTNETKIKSRFVGYPDMFCYVPCDDFLRGSVDFDIGLFVEVKRGRTQPLRRRRTPFRRFCNDYQKVVFEIVSRYYPVYLAIIDINTKTLCFMKFE